MEHLNQLLTSPALQMALPLLLIALVFYVRRKYHRELMALSGPLRDRLYSQFGRYRMMQFFAIALIILPVLMTGFDLPLFVGRESVPFFLSGTILFLWFSLGYEFLKRKLQELAMPDTFIQAYLGDRLVMAVTLALLLFFAWRRAMEAAV
ncbi:MAG: hypothetical protein RIF32_05770 [Leptospirales bacterium]|jgi:hypothetical protein